MMGPGLHERSAHGVLEVDPAQGQVHALLAIALAVNRLADAVNNLAATQQ
jgi:hypothetical protein